MKKSKIWAITTDVIQQALNECSTMVEICERFGVNPYNGSSKTFRQRITSGEFDLTQFTKNREANSIVRINTLRQIAKDHAVEPEFTENSSTPRKRIKRYILKNNIIEYKCKECGNLGEHCGKPLSLQLEHINGINNDNRLDNLCFLCPNCHSQTDTYAGKKLKIEKTYETEEQRNARFSLVRKFEVDKEELARLIATMPLVTIGKHFGVSDNAVRKRARLFGLEYKKKKTS